MEIFKPGVNIGKAIADRVQGFPVGEKRPKKKPKGKSHTCWIICHSFKVKPPKLIDKTASEKSYSFSVFIYGETRQEVLKALNHMIRCGYEEIEVGDKRFWLYAVKHSVQHRALFQAELKYIFRVYQIPEEIL